MSFEKYYDILFENGKLNDEYVTYLTYKHIENSLLNKDFNSNNSIYDLMKNYSNKFNQMLNKIEAPLGFLFDDVYDLYCFTKPHLDNILDNPKQSIIKESKLVRKEKLKQIEPKTITWLATKQGSTFREKIGQLNKIKTNVKRFSYNIPANQVVLSYYNRLYKLMNQKLSVIKENPNLFGAYDTKEINELQKQLYKLRNKVKEVFYEVDPKELIKANNTLLGNPDYRSVWNSNVDLKKYNINYEDSFLKFVDSLFECVVLSFMQELDSIEGSFNLDDIFGATLYSLNDNTLFVVEFEKNESLIIKTKAFKLNEGLLKIVDEKDFVVSIQREESNDGIGIPFLVKINGIPKGEFYGNLLGVKEVLNTINDTFQMNFGRKSLVKTNETNIEFVSINSYDNMAYGKDDLTVLLIDDHKDFIPNELYFSNSKVLYLNEHTGSNYLQLLKKISGYNLNNRFEPVIYDIQDTFDEFSSAELRKTFTAAFSGGYPVWRSILAGESVKNKNSYEMVIDLCGNEFSVSKLSQKNKLFIHYGPQEIPLYLQKFNEFDFLNEYIRNYESKYNISFPEDVKKDFIRSGKLSNLFLDKQIKYGAYKDLNSKFYCICFDKEIFNDLKIKFETYLDVLVDEYKGKGLFIVPNFISLNKSNVITNQTLVIGSRVIAKRVKEKAITWYEVLPDLSLEIIRDGMYDELKIVENQECENIIGKKFIINPKEEFTLTKGQSNYILPLNKSFLGENNKSFVAKIEDKSFPLEEDVKVKLKVEYSFGNENSYILLFEPISKKSPFKQIEVVWEKEKFDDNVINPQIVDNILTREKLDTNLSSFLPTIVANMNKSIDNLNKGLWTYYNRKTEEEIDNFKKATKNARDLVNTKQRHDNYNKNARKEIENFFKKNNISQSILQLLKLSEQYRYSDPEKYIKRRVNLEDYYMGATMDPSIFDNEFFEYSFGCYGRYLNMYPGDKKVLEKARNSLIKIVSDNDYLSKKNIRIFMAGITSSITGRHAAIYEMAQVYPLFVRTLLDTIVDILDKLINFNWSQKYFEEVFAPNPNENGFLVRHSLEILLSILYCRNMVIFEDLKPNGKTARRLISIIKRLNLSMMKANFDEGVKVTQMRKTKYVITFDVPEELNRMWNVAYILILSLSSDKRVNLIKLKEDAK